jgi:hypothetical protein
MLPLLSCWRFGAGKGFGPLTGRRAVRGRTPTVDNQVVESVPLAHDQIFEAGDFLGRASADDPIVQAIMPAGSHRTRQVLADASRRLVQYAARWGEVYTTAGRMAGLAVWLRPAGHPAGIARGTSALLAALSADLEPDDTWRLVADGMRLARARHKAIHRPHWHLVTVATDEGRFDTIAGALLKPILDRADAEQIPCFTATARAQHVLFYLRLGFVSTREDDLTPRGPRVWSLVREPRGGGV